MAKLIDYDYKGGTNTSGNLQYIENGAALKNALLLWLTSFPGDIVNKPTLGGRITQFLNKPMTDESEFLLKETIKDGLKRDFPNLQVLEVKVSRNYQKMAWEISVSAYDASIKDFASVSVNMDGQA